MYTHICLSKRKDFISNNRQKNVAKYEILSPQKMRSTHSVCLELAHFSTNIYKHRNTFQNIARENNNKKILQRKKLSENWKN